MTGSVNMYIVTYLIATKLILIDNKNKIICENLEIVYHPCDYSVLNPHFDGGLYMKLRDSCTT